MTREWTYNGIKIKVMHKGRLKHRKSTYQTLVNSTTGAGQLTLETMSNLFEATRPKDPCPHSETLLLEKKNCLTCVREYEAKT